MLKYIENYTAAMDEYNRKLHSLQYQRDSTQRRADRLGPEHRKTAICLEKVRKFDALLATYEHEREPDWVHPVAEGVGAHIKALMMASILFHVGTRGPVGEDDVVYVEIAPRNDTVLATLNAKGERVWTIRFGISPLDKNAGSFYLIDTNTSLTGDDCFIGIRGTASHPYMSLPCTEEDLFRTVVEWNPQFPWDDEYLWTVVAAVKKTQDEAFLEWLEVGKRTFTL